MGRFRLLFPGFDGDALLRLRLFVQLRIMLAAVFLDLDLMLPFAFGGLLFLAYYKPDQTVNPV